MTYRPLADVVSNILAAPEKEGLSRPLKGSGYLDAGWHNVTIMAVNADRLEDQGRITLTFEATGDIHREAVWLLSSDKSRLSTTFRLLVGGLFQDKAIDYIAYLNTPEQHNFLEALRGMKLSFDIQPGPGYTIHLTDDGYVGVDTKSHEQVVGPAPSLFKLRQEAESRRLRRSYNQIVNTESTHETFNTEALRNAAAAILGTPQADDGTP